MLLSSAVKIFWHNWSDSRPHTTSEWVSRFFYDNWRFQHSKQTETEDFYLKTQIGKNHGDEGEKALYMVSKLQWILWNFLTFATYLMQSPFSMDLRVHKYSVALWFRTQIFQISIITWFARYEFFIIALIIAPNCCDWCAEISALSIISPTKIGALKHLEFGDNLKA